MSNKKSMPRAGAATTSVDAAAPETEDARAVRIQSAAALEREQLAGRKPDTTLFVSAAEEQETFDIVLGPDAEVRGHWDRYMERVIWRVPNDLVERFNRHFFVNQGRIVQAEASK